MEQSDIEHLAFSILHGTFDNNLIGGCSCELCRKIVVEMTKRCYEEAAKFYGLL